MLNYSPLAWMTRWSLLWSGGAVLLLGTVALVTYQVTRSASHAVSKDQHSRVEAGRRLIAPNITACPPEHAAAWLVPAAPGDPAVVSNAAAILNPAQLKSLGTSVRFASGSPTPKSPSIAVQFGGTFQGKGSCDSTLSDNPAAATLAAASLPLLVAHGLPLLTVPSPAAPTPATPATNAASNQPLGLVQYLVRSAAFRTDLAYLVTCVPDPTNPTPNAAGGFEYHGWVCAISATTASGTVLFVSLLSPTNQ